MILVLDNYDSFVFNIARYVEELGFSARVERNDRIGVEDILTSGAQALIISPGPCTPAEAGISTEAVRQLSGKIPILGICLGHQCIGAAFGAPVVSAEAPMHGRSSTIRHDRNGLFAGLPQGFRVGRYHSLAVICDERAPDLVACAWAEDGEVMALRHAAHPTFGVQFHPESVLTEHGYDLLATFLDIAADTSGRAARALRARTGTDSLSDRRRKATDGQPMTAFLASVSGPAEAELAIAGGADIIDLKNPAAGAFGALSPGRVHDTLAVVAGRRPVSAVTGELPMRQGVIRPAAEALAGAGIDYVKVGLFPDEERAAAIAALAPLAARTRLIGVIFVDREADLLEPLDDLAAAGFAGAMLDTADKQGGRLTARLGMGALSRFVETARARGLSVGLAGGLEAPDVPRLLPLAPDLLGFRGALCAASDRRAGLDPAAIAAIRRLIPQAQPAGDKVDYRLLAARGYDPGRAPGEETGERIFVRDFVLPVRIGAYSHERSSPQRVRFDVSVDIERRRGTTESMADVFSYDLVTDAIARLVEEGHFDFVETLAERIGAAVLAHPRARRAIVRLEKLDVGPGGVGVELTMTRPERAAGQNPVLAMLETARKPQV